MRYTFLEEKYNNKYNKYKLFEYDQFDDEDDEEDDDIDNIDQEKIDQMSYFCKNIEQLFIKLFYEDNSLEDKEGYIRVNKRLLNEIYRNDTLLTKACYNREADIVKSLLKYGADPNIQDKYGDTALVKAFLKDDYELVKLLLEHGADPNIQESNGWTAFMRACMHDSPDITELLLEHGADPSIQDNNGRNALYHTCLVGKLSNIKLLLEHGADPNIKDENGNSLLSNVIYYIKSPEVLKEVLNYYNLEDKNDLILRSLCINYDIDLLKTLLEQGLNPNFHSPNSDIPFLILAIFKQKYDAAKLLLDSGADINWKDRDGYTILHILCENQNGVEQQIQFVLENNINVDIKNKNNMTALDVCLNHNHSGSKVNVINLLLQKTSTSLIQEACDTFCHLLINKQSELFFYNVKELSALLQYGAKISPNMFYNLLIKAFDIYSYNRFEDYYSLDRYSKLFKKILDDINVSKISVSKKGDRAVGCFIKTLINENLDGNFNYIKELLSLMSNVDVNLLPSDETLLTYALRFINLPYGYELVKLLLKHGADPNKKNKKGFTPLGVALKFGNNKIIKLLSKDGIDTNNLTGQYALISALRNENYKLAKQLIKDNIDINVEYSDRYQSRISPFSLILRISEDKIRLPLLKLIIEHGLDVNSRNILVSITRSKLEQKDKESIIRLLLKKGADINKSNCLKSSLFDKDIELFNFLLKNGANINRTDSDGDTILLEVVRNKYDSRVDDSTVKLLLKHKIDVNKRNNKLETALYWSITNTKNDYTKLLLEHGADPNIHIMKGDTVLHLAVRNKDIELIKLLLEYDADPNIKNNSGKSPLDIAKTKEIRNLLQRKSK